MILPSSEIKDNFSRVACDYEKFADIQARLSDELLQRLQREELKPQVVLDIGCATGRLVSGLEKMFSKSKILGVDISFLMSKVAYENGLKSLAGDGCDLPFKDDKFNLVVSNVAYQWVNNLQKAFTEAARILDKEGFFLFSCFGAGTLNELRRSFRIEENLLPTKDLIYESLKQAGLRDIDLETVSRYKSFDNLTSILYWLKNIGANRVYSKRLFLTPGRLTKISDSYQKNYSRNGKAYATFEVIWAKARK